MSAKTIGLVLLLLLAVFGAGWVTGASGRTAVELALADARVRADAVTIRSEVLDGRVSLFAANFGDARRHFQDARGRAIRLQNQLRESGQAERAGRLEIVLAHLGDADRLASAMEPGAQASAEDAVRALDSALPPPAADAR
jgi:hypothetical protein